MVIVVETDGSLSLTVESRSGRTRVDGREVAAGTTVPLEPGRLLFETARAEPAGAMIDASPQASLLSTRLQELLATDPSGLIQNTSVSSGVRAIATICHLAAGPVPARVPGIDQRARAVDAFHLVCIVRVGVAQKTSRWRRLLAIAPRLSLRGKVHGGC